MLVVVAVDADCLSAVTLLGRPVRVAGKFFSVPSSSASTKWQKGKVETEERRESRETLRNGTERSKQTRQEREDSGSAVFLRAALVPMMMLLRCC